MTPLYSSATQFTNRVAIYHHGDPSHPEDVTSTTDPTGATATSVYDANGDLTRSTSPLGNVTTYTYDAVGHRKTTVSPRGNIAGANPAAFTTTYGYDAMDRVVSTVVADGTTPLKSYSAYDKNGNLWITVDGNNNWTVDQFNLANEQVETDRADGTKLTMSYWPDGTLHQRFDGANQPTRYDYDPLGRVETMTDPLNRTTTFSYTSDDQAAVETDADGGTITNSYDNAGELTNIDYSDPATPDVTYTYGPTGLRATMTDGTGTSTYIYDSLGRLIASRNGAGKTVTYAYNLRGDQTRVAYPGTPPVTHTFDADGRMTQVIDWNNNVTRFRYDPDRNLTRTSYPNGVTATATFDNADQTAGITDTQVATTIASWTYTHDDNGQLTGDTHTGVPGVNESYTYTPLEQLKNVNTNSYQYDPADNLTQQPGGQTQTYDAADQLCWTLPTASSNTCTTSPTGATSERYDARGNLTTITPPTGPTTTYGYDQANRLTRYNTSSATYTYNGDNLRTTKTVGGTTTSFVWDNSTIPLLLIDGTLKYIYGPDGTPIEQIAGTTAQYLQHDQLGSTRLITNTTGSVIGTYSYNPYGAVTAHTGTANTNLQYDGQYRDAETGLTYLRNRYYNPSTGQFVSRDPLEGLTQSAYGYVGARPLDAIDPTGETSWWQIGADVGALGITIVGCAGVESATLGLATGACLAGATWSGGQLGHDLASKVQHGAPATAPPCLNGVGPLLPGQSRCAGPPNEPTGTTLPPATRKTCSADPGYSQAAEPRTTPTTPFG